MGDSKINSLLTIAEEQERRVLEERNRIERVVEERQRLVQELSEKSSQKGRLIAENGIGEKRRAIQRGQGSLAAGVQQYQRRLEKEHEKLLAKLLTKQQELSRAQERLREANNQYDQARMERRKLEMLLAGRLHANSILSQTREEAAMDERNSPQVRPKAKES